MSYVCLLTVFNACCSSWTCVSALFAVTIEDSAGGGIEGGCGPAGLSLLSWAWRSIEHRAESVGVIWGITGIA
jgi:hypothetical protein